VLLELIELVHGWLGGRENNGKRVLRKRRLRLPCPARHELFAFPPEAAFMPPAMTVHPLDLRFQGVPGIIAAYLLECGGGELALIETGPGSTLPTLREAIHARGFTAEAVRHVLVTHIHLDHAGAAGWFARQGAQVYCHPNARRHLIDPSKLMDSARQVYGAAMDRLWGDMLPAPEPNVTALQDGEAVRIGETEVTALDTPGHARHHHALILEDMGFTGDVAGLRLEGSGYLSVTAAPPQFDPVAYVASIDRLRAAGLRKLWLTHFGAVADVEEHLCRYRDRVQEVHLQIRDWTTAGRSAEEVRELYRQAEHARARAAGVSDDLWARYELGNATAMCADGIRLHVEKSPSA
jgi:glyoxylase-like metal-dependent hydrolase (beta-lactamase superfamily II)